MLPKKVSRRPLVLRENLDNTVREFVESVRKVGGVVNTAVVMITAEGTVATKNPSYWLYIVATSKLQKDGLSHCIIEWDKLRGMGQMLAKS